MSAYFFDTSALVKRHVREAGSAWVRSLTGAKAPHAVYIVRITAVEVTSAVTRRQRGGSLTPAQGAPSSATSVVIFPPRGAPSSATSVVI